MARRKEQPNLFEAEFVRSLLDHLLLDSRLYTSSKDYLELLDFTVRLRNFAPFNAMLLHIQKPGLSYAASAKDWLERFGRHPKEKARPLLIMWPFGPVALVYDVLDTDGDDLPEDVSAFFARGAITKADVESFVGRLQTKQIEWNWFDGGDNSAGSIRVLSRSFDSKIGNQYRINVNRNHSTATQFATLAHELGHLFLGHLGPDSKLKIPDRSRLTHQQVELEAESVSYVVCSRNAVESKSQKYLSNFVEHNTTIDDLDVYKITSAAGAVESILGLAMNTRFDTFMK